MRRKKSLKSLEDLKISKTLECLSKLIQIENFWKFRVPKTLTKEKVVKVTGTRTNGHEI